MLTSLRHAFRVLRKDRGFTAVAICSMAIGIGATSAMFNFADAMLLRPLPVADPYRVIAINTAKSAPFGSNTTISYPDYLDLRDHNRTFEGLAAASYARFGFSPDTRTLPHMKFGLFVSGNFFDVLGVRPALGRVFRRDEDLVQVRRAPGNDALELDGILSDGTDFHQLGLDDFRGSHRTPSIAHSGTVGTLVAALMFNVGSCLSPGMAWCRGVRQPG